MYCRYCRHHCQPQQEIDVMAPVFATFLWIFAKVAKIVPVSIKKWIKKHEGPGTNSLGPM